jgi:hypothetical protein
MEGPVDGYQLGWAIELIINNIETRNTNNNLLAFMMKIFLNKKMGLQTYWGFGLKNTNYYCC